MEPIEVQRVDFHPIANSRENYTQEYDIVANTAMQTPVLRRGQNFAFSMQFKRNFDEVTDIVRINLSFGPKPSPAKGTKVIIPVLIDQKQFVNVSNRWALCVEEIKDNVVTVKIHIPPSVQVGIWKCSIQTNICGEKGRRKDFQCEEDLYVIFNPWCKDDPVYMENEQERKEYILNESGKIWCGTFKKPKGKRWIFGQFDEVCLPASVFLLEKSTLDHSDRGSPINANDDDGLLIGRWDGEYEDGTSPFAWTGTTAIMDEFFRTGGQSVKYGQCWVYSAATVTVCRALGIPCRSTTNYVSAHDTNKSLTVDKYFDMGGNLLEAGPDGEGNDSCWNFHVWNDVWMARPDLPLGYGGWQIIDATPQEVSGNIYQCGPASVEAVRKGEVGYLYDTPFVFSEVNADVCHFQENHESDWGFSKLSINQYHVGRKIVTKRVDKNDDEGDCDIWDVTSVYKNPEGSEAERLAVFNAIRGVPKAQQVYDMPLDIKNDVAFDLVDIDVVRIGKLFEVVVNIVNNSKELRTIKAVLSASSIYYTGAIAKSVKKGQGIFTLKPGGSETLRIKVTPEEYLPKLVDHSLVKIYAIANVKETKQTWSEEDDFTLTKPQLKIAVQGQAQVGIQCAVTFSFKNPLKIVLTDCSFTFEGPGLQKPKTVNYPDVKEKEEVVFKETFVPQKSGPLTIVATFTSKQLEGIGGSANIKVN